MHGWQKCANRRSFPRVSATAVRSAVARAATTAISACAESVCGKWPMKALSQA